MLLKKCLHCDKIPGGKQLINMKHRDSRVLKVRQVLSSGIRAFPKEGVGTGVHGVWIVWRASVVAAHSLCVPTRLVSLLWGLFGSGMEDLWGGPDTCFWTWSIPIICGEDNQSHPFPLRASLPPNAMEKQVQTCTLEPGGRQIWLMCFLCLWMLRWSLHFVHIYFLTNRFFSHSLLNRDLCEQRRTTIPNTGHFVLFCFACDF